MWHSSRMRQKELRIALVCYGGISLAVYMHGVTKELWKLVRASRSRVAAEPSGHGSEAIYRRMLDAVASDHGLSLRVLTDIVAGASAGGINGVFLSQAIHSGQSLEPLTQLWLEGADVDALLDPDARPWNRASKFWAQPLVWWALRRPGNVVSASVARETRSEVRAKLSRLIRSRWFEPPFGGIGFSRMLIGALDAMRKSETTPPLLPPEHPLDLFTTATDFRGFMQTVRLNSPPLVEESEHRLSIGFRAATPAHGGGSLASPYELLVAARATASFPGAFPPLQLREIDALAAERGETWDSRENFTSRILPAHRRTGAAEDVAMIDGSVLVNAPFAQAMGVLHDRPAQREVDRRFVYIDPHPDRVGDQRRDDSSLPGFFSVIFGSLSSIPREQPVRDNLEVLARRSQEMARLRSIVDALQPEVEETVERVYGRTFFLDKPTPKRLAAWRAKAHQAAAASAGFAYHGYAQVKVNSIVDHLARTIHAAAPGLGLANAEPIARRLGAWLESNGLDRLAANRGGASAGAIRFFGEHDLPFRIRRLRLLARRLTQEPGDNGRDFRPERERARDDVYRALSLYFERDGAKALGADFPEIAARVFDNPGMVLDTMARRRDLGTVDDEADVLIAQALGVLPSALRRKALFAYLGFSFYDTITLPLLHGAEMTEFEPVKVDRISPDDALAIRDGGAQATLRGVEFYNFGAFFSRAYRENDYLWGRLHGAERMIDLVASALPEGVIFPAQDMANLKRDAFLAILDEEKARLTAEPGMIAGLRAEVLERLPV